MQANDPIALKHYLDRTEVRKVKAILIATPRIKNPNAKITLLHMGSRGILPRHRVAGYYHNLRNVERILRESRDNEARTVNRVRELI